MILVMLDNNWEKWAWQAMVKDEKGMNVEQCKAFVGKDEFMKQQPEAKYSDSECGNQEYGGWNEEGVLKFAEVRDKIKEARRNKECRKVEMQFQKLLERKYPGKPRKTPKAKEVKAPPARTSVAFGAGRKKKAKGGKASLHAVYDSEEETERMKAVLNFNEKGSKKKQPEKKKKKKKKGGKATEKGVAADDEDEEVDQDKVDAAMESSEEDDDDLIKTKWKPKNKKAANSSAPAADAGAAAAAEEEEEDGDGDGNDE